MTAPRPRQERLATKPAPPADARSGYGIPSTRTIEMLSAELEAANDKITAARQDADAAKAAHAEADRKLAGMTSQRDNALSALKASEVTLNANQDRIAELGDKLAAQRSENDDLVVRNGNLKSAIAEAEHERDEARDVVAGLRADLDVHRAAVAAHQRSRAALATDLTTDLRHADTDRKTAARTAATGRDDKGRRVSRRDRRERHAAALARFEVLDQLHRRVTAP